jgi:hypothetical protein
LAGGRLGVQPAVVIEGVHMSTEVTGRTVDAMRAAIVGLVAYLLAIGAGELFELNADSDDAGLSAGTWAVTILIGVVIVLGAAWLGGKALASPDAGRVARFALGLGIASLVTILVFWTGAPLVLGAVATVTALDYRRRTNSLGAMAGTGLVLGVVAFVAGAVICVVG